MILGIDVGGTHTDAVLIENLEVIKKAKVLTDSQNILKSLLNVTQTLFKEKSPKKLKRVVLSTTISTNAIVQNKVDRVGMILIDGPGLSRSYLKINEDTYFVSGYINHRGVEAAPINSKEISGVIQAFQNEGIVHAGVVGKFSSRNPQHELAIGNNLKGQMKHVSLGHRLSGHLNFPRRIATTYLNEAICDIYSNFVTQVIHFVRELNITAPIYILKADGGTFDIRQSTEYPVETILSGPAASIMGILSLADIKDDAIALDIGGTTTDIAVFADAVPLLEPYGVQIDRYKTLIRGLQTRSIGIGGDSRVKLEGDKLVIGPERDGPAAACGGMYPTPTDAMIVLGLTDIGDKGAAEEAVKGIAEKCNRSMMDTAKAIYEETCARIAMQVTDMIKKINDKPVYTIHELLEGRQLKPKVLYVVGGPSGAMAPRLGQLLGCPVQIPPHAEVANAIGAALARATAELTLLADTERKTLVIAEEGIQMAIPPHFTREDTVRIGTEKLREKAVGMGAEEKDLEIEVVESQEFNMVRGFYTSGKNIRVKLQIKPGLIAGLSK
jgi:N-methylhydantoinase A/oxoprolinase/acetone carboxylase beta subunit